MKRFSFLSYEKAHVNNVMTYSKMIERLFEDAIKDILGLTSRYAYDKLISENPRLQRLINERVAELANSLEVTIEEGVKREWLFSCKKNDDLVNALFDTTKLPKQKLATYNAQHLEVLKRFQNRKINGMNLSKRVWNLSEDFKRQLEFTIDVGLGSGKSAQELSRFVKRYLKNPNALYRRVRNSKGILIPSKAMQAYHPGQGVYRSAHKNAMRLARTEINMAYRTNDHLKMNSFDFVTGFEIRRSNQRHRCHCPMCERLQGVYPKWFKFVGWHPQCMCYVLPIVIADSEFREQRRQKLFNAYHGVRDKNVKKSKQITEFPKEFMEWLDENKEKQWKTTPYFIRDNFKGGTITGGFLH